MAKSTKPLRAVDDAPSEDEEFRPTRKIRKSNAAKQATAEARRQRRREAYARNAVKIRETNRIHIAKRRAAAKSRDTNSMEAKVNKGRESDLATAELEASHTLAQMQAVRVAQENLSSSTELSPMAGENEEQVDREISELWEAGKRQDTTADSSDEDEETAAAIMREMDEKSRALRSIRNQRIRRLEMLQTIGPRFSSRHSPSPDPPSPSPQERLPSLYDKLFKVGKEGEREL